MVRRRTGPAGLLLVPGAGSDSSHSALVAIEGALAPRPVRRVDFPYRRAGRKMPDRAPILVGCVREEAQHFAQSLGIATDRVVLGGRSMGGRMCSIAAAGPGVGAADDGAALPVAGLVLISYPLHPPGKADKLRVDHLDRLDVPCLSVHGTRDPFGSPDELQAWTDHIPGPVVHHWVDGGRHDLRNADADVAAAVRRWWSEDRGWS